MSETYCGVVAENIGYMHMALHFYGAKLRDEYNKKLVEISREDRNFADGIVHHWSNAPLPKENLIKILEGSNDE